EVRLGLREGRLEGAGIDGEKGISLLHVVAFLEVHLLELATHLGLDGDDRVRLNRSDRLDLDRHRLLLDDGDADRNGRRLRRLLGLCRIARTAGEARCEHDGERELKTYAEPPPGPAPVEG